MSITVISQPEKEKLYTQVFHLLGMPVRGIELTEEQIEETQLAVLLVNFIPRNL